MRFRAAPDPRRAQQAYRRLAARYDRGLASAFVAPVRRRALARLAPRPGEVVIDVACGTGINFPAIEEQIGPTGHLIGVDVSPEMLDQARRRVDAAGWENVELVESDIKDLRLPLRAGSALLSFTHDVLRSPAAVEALLRHLRPDARVVAAGAKAAPWWAAPLSLALWIGSRRYVTTFEGSRRPWSHLLTQLHDAHIEQMQLGTAYVLSGRVEGDEPALRAA